MSDRERASNWSRLGVFVVLLIGALALMQPGGPVGATTAQGAPKPAKTRGPYSPIGLTFDSCVGPNAPVKMIARKAGASVAPAPAGYVYVATVHHLVSFTDIAGGAHGSNPNTDVDIYISGKSTC